MNEIKIDLTEVNTQEFFGQQNINIEKLRCCFPKLKIVARGTTLKVFGEEVLLDEFEKRVDLMITYFGKYNKLNEEAVDRIITSSTLTEFDPSLEGENFITWRGWKDNKSSESQSAAIVGNL